MATRRAHDLGHTAERHREEHVRTCDDGVRLVLHDGRVLHLGGEPDHDGAAMTVALEAPPGPPGAEPRREGVRV